MSAGNASVLESACQSPAGLQAKAPSVGSCISSRRRVSNNTRSEPVSPPAASRRHDRSREDSGECLLEAHRASQSARHLQTGTSGRGYARMLELPRRAGTPVPIGATLPVPSQSPYPCQPLSSICLIGIGGMSAGSAPFLRAPATPSAVLAQGSVRRLVHPQMDDTPQRYSDVARPEPVAPASRLVGIVCSGFPGYVCWKLRQFFCA